MGTITLKRGVNEILLQKEMVLLATPKVSFGLLISVSDILNDTENFRGELKKLKTAQVNPSEIMAFCISRSVSRVREVLARYRILRVTEYSEQFRGGLLFPELKLLTPSPADNGRSVLIVEDSPAIARILKKCFESTNFFRHILEAKTLAEARHILKERKLDLISLDMILPDGNGSDILTEFPQYASSTILITDCSKEQSPFILECLDKGALAYFKKPSLDKLQDLRDNLHEIIQQLPSRSKLVSRPRKSAAQKINWQDKKLIVIGSSTGGTEIVKKLITELPRQCPPIVVVQHMPEAFTGPYAERLGRQTMKPTKEIKGPLELKHGEAYIAAGGTHAVIYRENGRLWVRSEKGPEVNRFCPSVSVLFDSVAEQRLAPYALAFMLTGMGHDGALEMKKLHDQGAITFAQSQESCVVYGMPRAAHELGAIDYLLSPDDMVEMFLPIRAS